MSIRLAVVVQRYGADINGGAELHARYVAERLSPHADVRVLTTCARDYLTWRNELPAGEERVNGVPVERFPVVHERDLTEYARRSAHVFDERHSLNDELEWLDAQGPACPALVERLRTAADAFSFVLLFSVRYYHAYHGARAVPDRAILVPTAEREPAIGLGLMAPVLRGVRAIMYNSHEERALIEGISNNVHVPGVVVGVGSDVPSSTDAARARQKFGLVNPFVVYVGRIDENKGCAALFTDFLRFLEYTRRDVDLVLIGTPVMPIPSHPRIRHLGFVSDADKFDVMAAATLLVMPSPFESLSMVALESWALGRPVLANGRCDVLVGQCLRSNAGLYYEGAREFRAVLERMLDDPALAAALGANGREYFAQHYRWPVIERKYLTMFERLATDPPPHRMEPLPGWWGRRRRLDPARAVIARVPAGPVTEHT